MSGVQTVITITHGSEAYQTIVDKLLKASSKPKEQAIAVKNFMNAFAGTDRNGKFTAQINSGAAVFATGTITLSSFVATDTVTIAGVVLTCVASGATGAQFNVGGTDTLTAVALAAKINAYTPTNQIVSATSALGVVTLTCLVPGTIGNLVTTAISAHGSVSGGGLLASGALATTYSTVNTYHFGV